MKPDGDLIEDGGKLISKYNDSKKMLFSKKDLIGTLANWSIRQSPKNIPDDLETVLDKFQDHINIYFERLEKKDLGFMEMDIPELTKFLMGNLITIKEFKEWNLSQAEIDLDIKIEDERGEYCNSFVSIHSENNPYFEFVDLDALVRNICFSVYETNYKI